MGWNPAAQFIGQQLDLEREVACDDWVLSLGGMVRPYALCLTKLAERAAWPRHPIPAPGVFATRKHISLRIERLLGAGRNIATNLAPAPAVAAIAVVGVLALLIAAVAPSVAASYVAPVTAPPVAGAPVKAREIVRYVRVGSAPSASTSPTSTTRVVTIPATRVHVAARTIHVPAVNVDVPRRTFTMPSVPYVDAAQITSTVKKSLALAFGAKSTHAPQNGRSCSGCDFGAVDWSGRDMRGVNYSGVDLRNARLVGTDFGGSNFNGADFTYANLRNASFRGAQ